MSDQPILIPILGKESGDRWRLTGFWNGDANHTGQWVYPFIYEGEKYELTIPFGFSKLDGASVPRGVRPIVKMGGRDMPDEAWIPHDFMYYYKGRMPQGLLIVYRDGARQDVPEVSRKFVDQVFHHELKSPVHSLASFKPRLAYLGVRAAFWKNW